MVKQDGRRYNYSGGLGRSGYVLSIREADIPRWKTAIDALHKAAALKYYDHWGLDKDGFGLVPLPKK